MGFSARSSMHSSLPFEMRQSANRFAQYSGPTHVRSISSGQALWNIWATAGVDEQKRCTEIQIVKIRIRVL
jgi:hypothetical protein